MMETSINLDNVNEDVSNLREIKNETELSLEKKLVEQKELTKERFPKVIRRTKMDFLPSKYGVLLPSPSSSKVIRSSSSFVIH